MKIAKQGVKMHFIKRIYLFTHINMQQFKRKWLLLPLILLFPIMIVGIIITLAFFYINPDESEPIKIGIVNHDQSQEIEVIINLLEESAEFGSFIDVESMSENKAKERILTDDLSAYISFPHEFTKDLYVGKSVTLNVVGNKNKETESFIVKELIDSMMRHIRTSQASILMINEHAKTLGMNYEDRQALIFEHFTTSFLNILGKDNVISEEKVTNHATTSPIQYYAISLIFILILIWLIITYNVQYKKETKRLYDRMTLYGVTQYEQIIARMISTLLMTAVFTFLSVIILQYFVPFDLYGEDIIRISLIILLNSIIYLQFLAFLEMLISSERIRLLLQAVITLLLIVLSGAVLPTIYLPLSIQHYITYIPAYHSLYWLQEILLNERLYADFKLLIIYVLGGMVILSGLSFIKERV